MAKEQKYYHVYLMASISKVIYVGMTGKFRRRVKQHKTKQNPKSFTARYHVTKLVYYERYENVNDAIAREKQLKKWRREKKINLIESVNPDWKDLSTDPQFDRGEGPF